MGENKRLNHWLANTISSFLIQHDELNLPGLQCRSFYSDECGSLVLPIARIPSGLLTHEPIVDKQPMADNPSKAPVGEFKFGNQGNGKESKHDSSDRLQALHVHRAKLGASGITTGGHPRAFYGG
jgi:hypothetical protein